MKKILSFSLILAMGFALVACDYNNANMNNTGNNPVATGNNLTNDNNDLANDINNVTGIYEINKSNWQTVVMDNYGVDMALPAGWSIKDAKSYDNDSKVHVVLNHSGATTPKQFGKQLFDKTKTMSTLDLRHPTDDKKVFKTFDDAKKSKDVYSWRVNYGMTNIQNGVIHYKINKNTVDLKFDY